jgi:hypothetical protein
VKKTALATALALTASLVGLVLPDTPARAAAPRTGVLIVDHGEPPEYNEDTYESFRAFFDHLIEMGLIPAWLKLLDTGTIVQDSGCFGCSEAAASPALVDAWLDPHEGPAVHVPASSSLPAHYVVPGGPGLGEPDIFEHVGLQAMHEWELMGGRSPNYDQKLPKKLQVIELLKERFGASLPVRVGYGIDPRLNGGYQGLRQAIVELIRQDHVSRIVVAYHGVGYSDIMQTHMIRHEVEEIAASLDPDVKLTYADPIGTEKAYIGAVAAFARQQVQSLPRGAKVALHLSGHGLSTTTCGEYECGEDAYHAFARRLFRRTKSAIESVIPDRVGVFHLYGDGATDEDDPDDLVDSPMEALAKRKEAGYRYVVDIPYEFDSDSRDTLIILRQGYERPIPDWNEDLVSEFDHEGMTVRITHAHFGAAAKTEAFYEVIRKALLRADRPEGHDH